MGKEANGQKRCAEKNEIFEAREKICLYYRPFSSLMTYSPFFRHLFPKKSAFMPQKFGICAAKRWAENRA